MSITLTGSAVIVAAIIVILMSLIFIGVLCLVMLHVYDRLWTKFTTNTKFHRELVDFVRHKYAKRRMT